MSSSITPPDGSSESGYRTREIPRVGADGRPASGHREVVARQKEEFGGMKFGSAFFGWLAATGMAVLLTALVAGVLAALGLGGNGTASPATAGNLQTAGLVGGIVVLVILLVAYFCGGYVAGRMARFNGVKQGIAVWLWAIIIAVLLGIIAAIAGSRLNLASQLNGLPNLAMDNGRVSTAGIVGAVAVLVVSLVGAILGGLSGMRFHRKVDRFGHEG
ncbi:MAG TPA: hypothetical protein VF635_03250 [Propionibacteriaceae bacterium]|jgi:hypothetical protein